MKKRSKKKYSFIAAGIMAAVAVLAAAYALWGRPARPEESVIYKEETVSCGDMMQGITESGSIELLTRDQTFDVVIMEEEEEDSDSGEEEESRDLKIEAVYVKQGQRIQEGDALLKVSERSIYSARRYLEAEIAEARITLERLQNEQETEQAAAKGTLQKSLTGQVFSETEYAIETARMQKEVEQILDSVAVLQQEIKQTETDLADSYEEYADLKEEYDIYQRRYEEWDKENLYTYIPLRTQYLEIRERYEDETEKRQEQREEIQEKQEEIQEKQAEAVRLKSKMEQRNMEARQRCETALLDGEMAQDVYEYSLQELAQELKTAEEELEELQEKLDEFHAFTGEDGIVYAQGSGLVTQVYYDAGDILQGESSLFTYVEEDSYVLSVDVLEEDIAAIQVGDTVRIVFTAYPDEICSGTVEKIANTEASQNTVAVSYPVTVKIEGDTGKLYGGMTGDVTFVTDQVTKAVYVSRRAVIKDGGRSYVTVRGDDGEMVHREVKTGFSDGVNIQITEGLSAGETVYIAGKR